MNDEPRESIHLENGVRIISEHVQGVRSVSVGVIVDAGSKDETDAQRGYAHLLEHMLFQGTDQRDAAAIAEMMEVGGGAIGAFTTRDYTVYHATVLDDYVPFALEALGDMLSSSILPEEALNRQRSVILNEIAGNDSPVNTVNNLLKMTLWPDHPLGYPVAGFERTLQAASRDSLVRFLADHYVGPRLIVAAAGNITAADFADQARDSFWPIVAKGQAPASAAPALGNSTVAVEQRDVQQIYFALAWPAPDYCAPDRYRWHLFSSMLGGSPTSRLYRKLREEKGLVYHVSAQYQAYRSAGAFVVEGATRPQTLAPVLAGILIELHRMAEETINLDDHFRARQSLISQHLVSGDSPYVRMSRLGLQELYFRKPLPSYEIIGQLSNQTPEDIPQLAGQLLASGLPTIALVGPVDEGLMKTVESLLIDFGGKPVIRFEPRRPEMVMPA